MKALVTGATGFVGPYLVRELMENGYKVTALAPERVSLPRGVRFLKQDLRNLNRLPGPKPDVVFHLAAISNVPFSRRFPAETYAINVRGTANLLRTVGSARVVLVSTADLYLSQPHPIRESDAVEPMNPYSASKLCAEAVARARSRDLIVLRPFNHLGPGQSTAFVAPSFAEQVASAERGGGGMSVGDLTPIRDFTDVRDVVRAYRLAAERGRAGRTYNIASGRGTSIQTLLDLLLAAATRRIRVTRDVRRVRGDADTSRVGDASLFRRETKWKPLYPLHMTLVDLLDHHRRLIRDTIRSG